MTLHTIFQHLRKNNPGEYRLFLGCNTFAILLISSFLAVLTSPLVQSVLPEGGDSRKQVYIIFAAALLGCFLFTIYSSSLFLRYKSRETGILTAMGLPRKTYMRSLSRELLSLLALCAVCGTAAGQLLSFIVWLCFLPLVKQSTGAAFSISARGLLYTLLFVILIAVSLFIQANLFMKRSNVIEIIQEQHRSEPLKKTVTPGYLLSGCILLVSGLFLALCLSPLSLRLFHRSLGSLPSVFFLPAFLGIYRILVYSISCHKKGARPQHYYNHIISYNMLKFLGAQMVRSMCIITLLLFCGLFGAFYVPTLMTGLSNFNTQNPEDVSFFYPADSGELTKEEFYHIAGDFGVTITAYHELTFLNLIGSSVDRDYDDQGYLIETYMEKSGYMQFLSESAYNAYTGEAVRVQPGTYLLLTHPDAAETIWAHFDDLDQITDLNGNAHPVSFAGTLVCHQLVVGRGSDTQARYVLSDSDYAMLSEGAADKNKTKQVLFQTADAENSYAFARELYRAFSERASSEMLVLGNYDPYQHEQARSQGKEYGYDRTVTLYPEQPERDFDWKYAPYFKILEQKISFVRHAVFFLLFLYVAIICLAAAVIIAYTRGLTLGQSERLVFRDLSQLGANTAFLRGCLSSQLRRLFLLPSVIGILSAYLFDFFVMFTNDGHIASAEAMALAINGSICLTAALLLAAAYGYSVKKACRAAGC